MNGRYCERNVQEKVLGIVKYKSEGPSGMGHGIFVGYFLEEVSPTCWRAKPRNGVNDN